MERRIGFLNRNRKFLENLRKLGASRCAYPGCQQTQIIREGLYINTLEVCHIAAISKNGPRGDSSLSEDELHDFGNLILLCPYHHRIVDTFVNIFPFESLKEMKKNQEEFIIRSTADTTHKKTLHLPISKNADFIKQLKNLPIGQSTARDYQNLIFHILNFLFEGELIDGEMEEKTIDGTERRDIVYMSWSKNPFWTYTRMYYGNILVMFETKNTRVLSMRDINQVATYLGDSLGRMGFIVTRKECGRNILLKTFKVYHSIHSSPRIILILSDSDIEKMLQLKVDGYDPVEHIRKIYKNFLIGLQ